MTTDTISVFDSAGAMKHCKTAGNIFEQMGMDADEAGELLAALEPRLSAALSAQ